MKYIIYSFLTLLASNAFGSKVKPDTKKRTVQYAPIRNINTSDIINLIEEHNIQNDAMYAEPDYILPAIEDEYKDIISDSNPEVITNLFD